MCIIIDANRAAAFANADPSAAPIAAWLKKPQARLAIGGSKLAREYRAVAKFVAVLAALDTAGRVRRYKDQDVNDAQDIVQLEANLTSDDPHIIALARVSGARVLYSLDVALHQDFRSPSLLRPRGRVYQNAGHAHLLESGPGCK